MIDITPGLIDVEISSEANSEEVFYSFDTLVNKVVAAKTETLKLKHTSWFDSPGKYVEIVFSHSWMDYTAKGIVQSVEKIIDHNHREAVFYIVIELIKPMEGMTEAKGFKIDSFHWIGGALNQALNEVHTKKNLPLILITEVPIVVGDKMPPYYLKKWIFNHNYFTYELTGTIREIKKLKSMQWWNKIEVKKLLPHSFNRIGKDSARGFGHF